MGVFSKSNNPKKKVDRNTFDGSFQNNLTMKMGYLYPCINKEVIPGDTLHIDAATGFRFMPTAFPLQTKIISRVEFFYVRYRNLWNKWMNYYTGVGSHDGFPVIKGNALRDNLKTGSLGDYLGLPTTYVKSNDLSLFTLYRRDRLPSTAVFSASCFNENTGIGSQSFLYKDSDDYYPIGFYLSRVNNPAMSPSVVNCSGLPADSFCDMSDHIDINYPEDVFGGEVVYYRVKLDLSPEQLSILSCKPIEDSEIAASVPGGNRQSVKLLDYSAANLVLFSQNSDEVSFNESSTSTYVSRRTYVGNSSTTHAYHAPAFIVRNGKLYCLFDSIPESHYRYWLGYLPYRLNVDDTPEKYANVSTILGTFPSFVSSTSVAGIDEVTNNVNLYSDLSVSALPFRAYEQIYNAFYRDDRNNPYIAPGGEYDPNVFIPTSAGGSDTSVYELHKRNWEQDFLTSALPSPQFGTAPLVGLTSSGVATFQDVDGKSYESKLSVGEDGETIVGFSATGSSAVNSSLINLASSGISINDLRGVNALQKYLENTYRRGLRYRDQLFEHHGVDVGYDVLDMPEFLGGFSQTVNVTQINQTAPSSVDGVTDPLGSYAGQLSAIGSGPSIHKFFDEPGLIIGIISVVPVPCYSQLMPKHFLKINERLDYYFPEFARLGNQPVLYNEVCPFQQKYFGGSTSATFGYQRAWYDYLSNVDEVHGGFRTNLNNFVLQRNFSMPPSLTSEFLTVSPDSLNDPFTVNEVNGEPVDTILGQIHFRISMERPIPRFNVPSLD